MHQTEKGVMKKLGPLLTITEFSSISGVKKNELHYWNDIGLFTPARRIAGGCRYYTQDQVTPARLFQVLSSLGIPMNRITGADSGEFYRDCDELLSEKIEELQVHREALQKYVAMSTKCRAVQPVKIEVCTLPAQAMRRASSKRKSGVIAKAGDCGNPLGYVYLDIYSLLEEPDQPAQLIVFEPQGPEIRPAGKYLVGTAKCAYGEMGGLPRRMLEHAMDNSLELQGPVYTVYLPGTADAAGLEKYLLQIAVGVEGASAL